MIVWRAVIFEFSLEQQKREHEIMGFDNVELFQFDEL